MIPALAQEAETQMLAIDETPSAAEGQEGSGLIVVNGHAIPARFHPLAQLFPMIDGEAFKALVEDVKVNGVRRPIVMHEGMILDGRNRYMAAREAEISYRVVDFAGDDPVSYVVSENLNRRHLTDSQRQMVGARIAKLPRGVRSDTANAASVPSQSQTAAMLGVSVDGIQRAKHVVETGAPSLVAAVQSGEVSVSAAAEVAKLPEPEQVEIVERGPAAVREAAKAVREERKAPPSDAVEKQDTAPSEPVDPERRKLAKLTTDALIDEVLGLRANLADEKAWTAKLKAEKEEIAAKLAAATSGEQGRVIGQLQRQIDTLKGRMAEHQTAAKRYEFRAKKAEARAKELEALPIDMGAV